MPVFRYPLVSWSISFWTASSSWTVINRCCVRSSFPVLSFQLMNLFNQATARSSTFQSKYCCHNFWHPSVVVLIVVMAVVCWLQTSDLSGSSSGRSLKFYHLFSVGCKNLGPVSHLPSLHSSLAGTPQEMSSAGMSLLGVSPFALCGYPVYGGDSVGYVCFKSPALVGYIMKHEHALCPEY